MLTKPLISDAAPSGALCETDQGQITDRALPVMATPAAFAAGAAVVVVAYAAGDGLGDDEEDPWC
ncbi:hypothetical protein [Streptomyces sp. TRM49041]|uniref:hypothetical protein n=1 Tax=Streptomyces sp. TRM49041 TaxID=2603216 RepID=UPI0011EE8402|nr:hypothetical protein [Streptomyces sp. TRM49041]